MKQPSVFNFVFAYFSPTLLSSSRRSFLILNFSFPSLFSSFESYDLDLYSRSRSTRDPWVFARSYVNIPPPLKTINFSFPFCPSAAFLLSLHRSEPTVQPLLPSRGAHELLQPGHDVNSHDQRLTDARKAGRRSLDTGQGFESSFASLFYSPREFFNILRTLNLTSLNVFFEK